MFLNKNRCIDAGPMTPSMPRNDIFANIDIDQKYVNKSEKNIQMMPTMKGGSCGCNSSYEPMMNMGSHMNMGCGCKMQPVYEQPIEKCVHRTFCHEVPQV